MSTFDIFCKIWIFVEEMLIFSSNPKVTNVGKNLVNAISLSVSFLYEPKKGLKVAVFLFNTWFCFCFVIAESHFDLTIVCKQFLSSFIIITTWNILLLVLILVIAVILRLVKNVNVFLENSKSCKEYQIYPCQDSKSQAWARNLKN